MRKWDMKPTFTPITRVSKTKGKAIQSTDTKSKTDHLENVRNTYIMNPLRERSTAASSNYYYKSLN